MSELYMLTVIFRGSHSARFHFKSMQSVDGAYELLKPPPAFQIREEEQGTSFEAMPSYVEIADDYGNKASIDRREVIGHIRCHVNDDLNANADLSFLQSHATVKLNKRIQADPMLKVMPATTLPPGMRPNG